MTDFLSPSIDQAIRSSNDVELVRGDSVADTPPRGDANHTITLVPGTVSVTLRFVDGGKPATNPGDGTGITPGSEQPVPIYLDDLEDVETFGTSSAGLILISSTVGPTIQRWAPEKFTDVADAWIVGSGSEAAGEWFEAWATPGRMLEALGYSEDGSPVDIPGYPDIDILEPVVARLIATWNAANPIPVLNAATVYAALGYDRQTGAPLPPDETPNDGEFLTPSGEFDAVMDYWWDAKALPVFSATTILDALGYELDGGKIANKEHRLENVIFNFMQDYIIGEDGVPLTYVSILNALGYDAQSGVPLPNNTIARLSPVLAWHWTTTEFKNQLRGVMTNGGLPMVNRLALGYAQESAPGTATGEWLFAGTPELDPIIDDYLARHPIGEDGQPLTRSAVMAVLGYDLDGDPLENDSQALDGIMFSYFSNNVTAYVEDWWADLPAAALIAKLGYNPGTGAPQGAAALDPVIADYLVRNPVEGGGGGDPDPVELTREAIVEALDYVEDSASFLIDRPENRTYTFVLAWVPQSVISSSAQMGTGTGSVAVSIAGGNMTVTVTGASTTSRDARGFVRFTRNMS